MRPLNLASRPFRNEMLPALAFSLGGLALLGASAAHALTVARLLPGGASALHQEVASLRVELASLRGRLGSLAGPEPDPKQVAHWALLRDLVERRAFAWSELLARLEGVTPPGVRLISIAPSVRKGEVQLELVARARSFDEGVALVRALEDSAEFASVFPLGATSVEAGEEAEFRYTMHYLPPSVGGGS